MAMNATCGHAAALVTDFSVKQVDRGRNGVRRIVQIQFKAAVRAWRRTIPTSFGGAYRQRVNSVAKRGRAYSKNDRFCLGYAR